MHRKARRSGFTLVEVLIVVVILAILAAAVVPQFSSSTQDAKFSTSVFNLQTLRAQVQVYKAQHNGVYPDTLAKLTPYVAEMKMTYPVLQGLGQDGMLDAYGPMLALPTTVLISRQGLICQKHVGMGSKEGFENAIRALL